MRIALSVLAGILIFAAPLAARDYVVDSQANCIDLGSSAENVSGRVVTFSTYRSVPYMAQIDALQPPVYYDSNGNEFEGVFMGGCIGNGGSEPRDWWHRALDRETDLLLPAVTRIQDPLFLFLTDYGNLVDNSGAFHVRVVPTAWGDLPPLPVPEGICASATIVDPTTSKIYVFGGQRDNSVWYDETWVLNPYSGAGWGVISPATRPSARGYAKAIYDPNEGGNPRMVIFGGRDNPTNHLNDTWALDLVTEEWEQLPAAGEIPPGCIYHSVIRDPGGRPGNEHPRLIALGSGHELGSDVYAYDLVDYEWTLLLPGASGDPGPRCSPGLVYYRPEGGPAQAILFGGGYLSTYHNDLWTLDLDALTWDQLPCQGPDGVPPVGESGRMVIDPIEEKLLVYGGFNDVQYYMDELWCYDLQELEWNQFTQPSDGWPMAMHLHGVVFDVAHRAFVLIGGHGQDMYTPSVKAFVAEYDYLPLEPAALEDPTPTVRTSLPMSTYPVPSAGTTHIQFEPPAPGRVRVEILDLNGRLVRRLVDRTHAPELQHVVWNGRNDAGRQVDQGIYFCRVRSGTVQAVSQIIVAN